MNLLRLIISVIFAHVLIGCSSSNDGPVDSPATVVSFDIEPKITILDVGTGEFFKALVTYSDGNVSDVTDEVDWSLEDDSGIIEIQDNPENDGRLYAVAAQAGEDNIVATMDEMTTSSSVRVVEVSLTGIEITPIEASLPIGAEASFKAEGTYDDGHTQDLTEESNWTAFNASTANVVSITGKGLVSAVNEGTVNIRATYDSIDSNPAVINVNDPKEIVLIDVSPAFKQMFVGSAQQFTAVAYYSDGSIDFITNSALWLSSDTSVVAQDTFRKGEFDALSSGDAVVTAEFGIGNVGTAFVEAREIEIERIVVTPADDSVAVGETRNYFTEALLNNGTVQSINNAENQFYSVDNSAIAHISNDTSSKGELIGLSQGTTTIRSSFVYDGQTYTDETTVTVTP